MTTTIRDDYPTIFKMSSAVDYIALQDAYWIKFEENFDHHHHFTRVVSSYHPRIQIRHEFWGSGSNAVSVQVQDEGVLREVLDEIAGIKVIEPIVEYSKS